MTVETAVLIETLVDLGADVRWAVAIFFQLRIMQQQLLQTLVYLFMRGRGDA